MKILIGLVFAALVVPLAAGQATWGGLKFGMTPEEVKAVLGDRVRVGSPSKDALPDEFILEVSSLKVGDVSGMGRLIITLVIAAIGAVLGIINTAHLLSQRKVRLRVIPMSVAAQLGSGILTSQHEYKPGTMLGIEVINLSVFPVTISEVGYTLRGVSSRAAVAWPELTDQKGWPRRLEPRESVSAYINPSLLTRQVRRAYARTQCGVTRYGTSPALKELKRHLSRRATPTFGGVEGRANR